MMTSHMMTSQMILDGGKYVNAFRAFRLTGRAKMCCFLWVISNIKQTTFNLNWRGGISACHSNRMGDFSFLV